MTIGTDFDPLSVPAVMPQRVARVTADGRPTQSLLDWEQSTQGWMKANVTAMNTRFSQVSDAVDDSTASVATETAARIAGDDALAATITTVDTKVGNISAGGAVYLAAKAIPTGATAAYGWFITAGGSFAGMEAVALSGGGSAIALTANQLKFTDAGTLTDVLTYSAGKFRFTGDVAIDGSLAVSGSFNATAVASGFTNRGSIGDTASISATIGWTDLGLPMTLAITPDAGNAYPVIWIRDVATVSNLGGTPATAQVKIRLLINGTSYYEREIFNLAIPVSGSREGGITDFFDTGIASSSLTFQLQYQATIGGTVTGSVFAKTMVFMSSR